MLSRIKILEQQLQKKTEQHAESAQEVQESRLKVQSLQQRLAVQERLVEQIQQLREEKTALSEELTQLQSRVFALGEEILSESLDQELSKRILVKINRLVSPAKTVRDETPPVQPQQQQPPKRNTVVDSAKQESASNRSKPRANTMNTGPPANRKPSTQASPQQKRLETHNSTYDDAQ